MLGRCSEPGKRGDMAAGRGARIPGSGQNFRKAEVWVSRKQEHLQAACSSSPHLPAAEVAFGFDLSFFPPAPTPTD